MFQTTKQVCTSHGAKACLVCFESVWRFHQRKSRCIQQKWVELLAIVDLFDGGKWVSRQLSLGFDHQTNSMPQISKHQWQKQQEN